jgi:putative transposase
MNFRRYYVPNAVVFITQVVEDRYPAFRNENYLKLLRVMLRQVKVLHPFSMLGYVFLPDHFHLLIRPTGKSNFSQIMHSLKPNFTKAYKQAVGATGPMKFWQKRFYDHIIRDETDLVRLIGQVITVSLETVKVVKNLPPLDIKE